MTASSSVLTMTPTPLVLLGPGGDFADRLNVKGTALTRARGAVAGATSTGSTHPDGENAGAPGYDRPAQAERLRTQRQNMSAGSATPGLVRRAPDGFDASAAPAALTYGPDGRMRAPARVSVMSAAAAWLDLQSFSLGDLAHDHEQHRRAVLASLPHGATPAALASLASLASAAATTTSVAKVSRRPNVTVARLAARLIDAVLPPAFATHSDPTRTGLAHPDAATETGVGTRSRPNRPNRPDRPAFAFSNPPFLRECPA